MANALDCFLSSPPNVPTRCRFISKTKKNYMLSTSYPSKTMIATDSTIVLNSTVYDPKEIITCVRESTLPEHTKDVICKIVTDEEHFKTYQPDKFDVHFATKKCDSIFHIATNNQSDKCLCIIIE